MQPSIQTESFTRERMISKCFFRWPFQSQHSTYTHTPHSRPPTPTPIAVTSHEPCGLSIRLEISFIHYNIIIMSAMASQITRLTIIYSAFYSGEDQRKKSKLCVTGLRAENSPWPVNSPHKGPVTREMFPFDDVIMPTTCGLSSSWKSACLTLRLTLVTNGSGKCVISEANAGPWLKAK